MTLNASKRTTRLFGSFGGSGSEKNAGIENLRKSSTSTLGSPRDAPSSMSPRVVDIASSEMTTAQPDAVTDGSNLLERIGTPDYTGWMQKKGEKYNSWKPRFFVLKGIHLYWLKGEGVRLSPSSPAPNRADLLHCRPRLGAKGQGLHQPPRLPSHL
jgi:hypothetical protein